MTPETILLIGRETSNAREVLETHARRLERRGAADGVVVATYGSEPVAELRPQLEAVPDGTSYAVPMTVAHTPDTTEAVPAALSYVPGTVRYCEPPGRSPAITEALRQRAGDLVPAAEGVTLVLVGFGSGSKPYHRQAADYHAARLREQSDYGEVLTCYLLQDPAVECVRYGISTERSVAVPLFLTRTEATERRIPEALEPGRGALEYADPLGTHERVTDAVEAAVAQQRVLSGDGADPAASFEGRLAATQRPVATDGDGGRR